MKRNRTFLYILAILVLSAVFLGWKLFGPATSAPKSKYFYIKTGASYQDITNSLVSENIIGGSFWFDKVSKTLHYDKGVKPGRYKIEDGTSIVQLVKMLKGNKQSLVKFTITKLRTKEDLARRIGDNFEPDSSTVIAFLNNPDTLSNFQLDTSTVMTAIIPNTYSILWNTSPSKIFRKLWTEQQKTWNSKRREEAARLHLSEKQVYILASIVEEETNMYADKGKIASVYLNRMNAGMRLAADPTVKFALREFGLKRIFNSQTHFNSPYNTYTISGLPPGPICTPSIKTIDAVLNAPETGYMFFVARPDRSGYSNFASTYEEHKKYARIYQHWLDSLFTARKLNRDGTAPMN